MPGVDESPREDEALPTSAHELDELLEKLEAEESELSLRRRRLFDRIDRGAGSTSEWLLEEEREVSRQRRALHARIDALRAHRESLPPEGGQAA